MNLDLSQLARFHSPIVDPSPAELPYDYEITTPWKSSYGPVSSALSWETMTPQTPATTINCANTVYLRDSNGNNYPFVRYKEDIVEYIANFTTYSGGGGSCACIDFPAFSGTIEAITDIEFIGQGTAGGITAVNITRETVPLKPYFYRGQFIGDEVTPTLPTFYPNTILTARNGQIVGSNKNKTYYAVWDCVSTTSMTIGAPVALVPSKPVITDVYVYWAGENNERHYYGIARYNQAETSVSAIPEYAIYAVNRYY